MKPSVSAKPIPPSERDPLRAVRQWLAWPDRYKAPISHICAVAEECERLRPEVECVRAALRQAEMALASTVAEFNQLREDSQRIVEWARKSGIVG